jgi:hypothetical protein
LLAAQGLIFSADVDRISHGDVRHLTQQGAARLAETDFHFL